MKCKACNAELEEGVTLCPSCGFQNSSEHDMSCEQQEQSIVTEELSNNGTEQTSEQAEACENEETAAVAEMPEEQSSDKACTPIVEGKLTGGKIALLVVLAVAAIAVVVALVVGGLSGGTGAKDPSAPVETTEATIPSDGNPDDVTCKGTYTVTDEEILAQKDQVVATLNGEKLTNEELQIYYWMQVYDFLEKYGQYAAAFGMDTNTPLDMQKSMDPELTWQQFFLREALNSWKNYKSLSTKAREEGFEMNADFAKQLEDLPANLEATAKSSGFETVDDMIHADMGVGAGVGAYMAYMNDYYTGHLYYGSNMDKIEVTDAEVEAFFDSHADAYLEKGLKKGDDKVVDVRHILITPEGGTTDEKGNTTYSDEEWQACEQAAQAVLDEYLAGEQTQERFAELATKYSKDPGSAAKGGLYMNVRKGQMVAPFEEWSFDDSRAVGDYGLVKTDYGYHVMYYVDSRLIWHTTAMQDLLIEKGNEFLNNVVAQYDYTVDYPAIALGLADLNKK